MLDNAANLAQRPTMRPRGWTRSDDHQSKPLRTPTFGGMTMEEFGRLRVAPARGVGVGEGGAASASLITQHQVGRLGPLRKRGPQASSVGVTDNANPSNKTHPSRNLSDASIWLRSRSQNGLVCPHAHEMENLSIPCIGPTSQFAEKVGKPAQNQNRYRQTSPSTQSQNVSYSAQVPAIKTRID